MAKAALLCLAPQAEEGEGTVPALKLGQGVEALPLSPLQLLLVQRNQRVNPAGASLLFLSHLRRLLYLLCLLSAAAFPGGLP